MRERRAGARARVLEHQAVREPAVVAPVPQPRRVGLQHVAQFDRRESADSAIDVPRRFDDHLVAPRRAARSDERLAACRDGAAVRRRRILVRHDAHAPSAVARRAVRTRPAGVRCFLPGAERAGCGDDSVRRRIGRSAKRRRRSAVDRSRRIRWAGTARSSATMTVRPVSQSVRSSSGIRDAGSIASSTTASASGRCVARVSVCS